MARRRKPTKASVAIIGALVFIMFFFVIGSSGENLFLANPFTDDFNFNDIEAVFTQLGLLDVDISQLEPLLKSTGDPITDVYAKNCFLKLHTDLLDQDNNRIPLDSQFQFFSELTKFDLLTTSSGTKIDLFESEVRIRCDVLQQTNGGELPFEITTTGLTLDVWATDSSGSLKKLTVLSGKNIGKPKVTFDSSGLDDPIKIREGCTVNCGLGIGSERAISSAHKTTANSIENLIEDNKDFITRVEIRISGNVIYNNPFLDARTTGIFPISHSVDQNLIKNAVNLRVDIDEAPVTIPSDEDLTTLLTIPRESDKKVTLDGGTGRELIQVTAKLNDYQSQEGSPKAILVQHTNDPSRTLRTSVNQVATESCLDRGDNGLVWEFECRLFLPETLSTGTYYVEVTTLATNRALGTTSLEVFQSSTGGNGGNGETTPTQKTCSDCEGLAFRTIPIADICPAFDCGDGTDTGIGTPICKDGKPADKTSSGFTCNRTGGGNGDDKPIFPVFIDCETEGRSANVDKGEICVPALIFFLFDGLNFLWVGLVFIVVVIILSLIAKGINKQKSGMFLQG